MYVDYKSGKLLTFRWRQNSSCVANRKKKLYRESKPLNILPTRTEVALKNFEGAFEIPKGEFAFKNGCLQASESTCSMTLGRKEETRVVHRRLTSARFR